MIDAKLSSAGLSGRSIELSYSNQTQNLIAVAESSTNSQGGSPGELPPAER